MKIFRQNGKTRIGESSQIDNYAIIDQILSETSVKFTPLVLDFITTDYRGGYKLLITDKITTLYSKEYPSPPLFSDLETVHDVIMWINKIRKQALELKESFAHEVTFSIDFNIKEGSWSDSIPEKKGSEATK